MYKFFLIYTIIKSNTCLLRNIAVLRILYSGIVGLGLVTTHALLASPEGAYVNKDTHMKIAQIAPAWLAVPPKNYGGTENVIYNLVEELVALGHDVTLFAPGDARTSARQISFFSTSLIASGVPWSAYLKAHYHLYNAIDSVKQEHFDVVHTHLSSSADMCLFPLTASLVTPHVTTLHSHFPFDGVPGGWIGDADPLYLARWASSMPMVAISQSARAQAPQEVDFVGVVHHGVRMQDHRPKGEGEGEFFAWLGRFVPEKGAHLAIQAARQAEVPLMLAGQVQHHQESQHYFHEVIQPQIDGTQVQYVGPVDMKQKIKLLSQAGGLLNPITWEEPFGMVMIEAMAIGCPVISFARGAAPEIVVHGKTGFLVSDVEEMVRYIPRIAEIDRDTTRRHIELKFSARAMAENYVQVYRKVIQQSKARLITHDAPARKPTIILGSTPIKPPMPLNIQHQEANPAKRAARADPLSKSAALE
jgi:glycosyltransferase involved in cell wall biosynthesis